MGFESLQHIAPETFQLVWLAYYILTKIRVPRDIWQTLELVGQFCLLGRSLKNLISSDPYFSAHEVNVFQRK